MLKFGDTYLKFGGTYLSGYKVPTYNVILQQSTSGTISASPLSGHRNTEVTLSNIPNTDYIFKEYEISGSNLYNTNKFKFEESDVTVHAKWYKKTNPLNLPPNTVRVRTNDGNAPYKYDYTTYETATLVPGTSDVYDVYKSGTDFHLLLGKSSNVIEVLGANTTGITRMSEMFYLCTSLSTVSLFDTSNVTSMGSMFIGCDSLRTVPLFDTSNVTSMYHMFYQCHSLSTVPLFNTSNVTDMEGMFYECTSLSTVPLFDTSNVTNMISMFLACNNLTTVPLFNTSKVTNMYGMFSLCSSLRTVPLFNTSKVTNMDKMFYQCTSVQRGALALYQQASRQTNPPSSHSQTFRNCGSNTQTGAAELAQIPSNWK